MKDLTGFQRDLLLVIAGFDQPNGLEVKKEIENHYENKINPSQLYPNLDTLVDKGLVSKGQLDRRTNFYELTSESEETIKAFHEWRHQYLE